MISNSKFKRSMHSYASQLDRAVYGSFEDQIQIFLTLNSINTGDSIFFMEAHTHIQYKGFISGESKYMRLLQIDGFCGSFYKCSSFYHCRNHKRNFKEGSKDWLDTGTLRSCSNILSAILIH